MPDSVLSGQPSGIHNVHILDETQPHAMEATAADRLLGLTGGFKQWANLGLAGVMCGLACYALMYAIPAMHREGLAELREERRQSREEQRLERERHDAISARTAKHGDEAVEKIDKAFEKLGEKFADKQEVIIDQLRTMNARQAVQMESAAPVAE